MSAERFRVLVAALVLLPAVAVSQSSQSCQSGLKEPWYLKQRAWLDESKHDWTNDTLRTALLTAAGFNPAQLTTQPGVRIIGRDTPPLTPQATAFIAQLRKMPRGSPGPERSVVGPAGVHAFFLLALADSAYTETAMHKLMEAGPEASMAADVAVLEDIVRLRAGRKQIYGTQFRMGANGRAELAPMEDSTHADLRREDAGLPPFKISLCIAGLIR